jgi:multimeric flavodoxin WrbA
MNQQEVKVMGFHLSPRKNGSSMKLLNEFGQGVREAGGDFEYISISELSPIQGCLECNNCRQDGKCVVEDGMEVFYRAFDTAQRIVVATSLFFYDVPAQGKAVIDRSQAYWVRRYVLGQFREGKPGAKGFLLAVGATRGKDLFIAPSLSMKYFFDALAFPKDFDTLFFRKIENPADLTPEQLRSAKMSGFAFAQRD